nr:MAG TPA: hypothetical protein [Caudoviricetes sp.]DAW38936.1 MAG TPA: hypothetical protein [Caudoviricetes sp.]
MPCVALCGPLYGVLWRGNIGNTARRKSAV